MNILREALAGTLESGDAKIKVIPADGITEIVIRSEVMQQFGQQIHAVAVQTLATLGVNSGLVIIEDKGALDCVLRARIQCAVLRAAEVTSLDPEKLV
ncbi:MULTISPECIES: citrate lyase acyl carrier protein [Tatumella]|uniref:Citrate lyase acyl carrier protein n=2 Tax=Tatumella ptyseos TaxID=82987 RepID=A0A085JKD3_9GAMM|nr:MULTISPECIES: citrate lyase acyl carrier protein [Tatumella]KFD20929.1 citrate lyase gamma chain, acyl carrier protein [Tatumella ptyseos ATCC 33301]SQK77083.1 Citrate lyase gamma chain [Tatumella ptyseos]